MPATAPSTVPATTIRRALAAAVLVLGAVLALPSIASADPVGLLDPSFGVAGTTTIRASSGPDIVNDLVPLPDGSVLAFGSSDSSTPGTYDAVIFKLTPGGALDPSFDGDPTMPGYPGNGLARYSFGAGEDQFSSGVVAADGSIFAAGDSSSTTLVHTRDSLLAKLTSTGALAPGFTTSIYDFSGIGESDDAFGVALTPAGLPVTTGTAVSGTAPFGQTKTPIARYTASGALDTTFGCPAAVGCPGYVSVDPSQTPAAYNYDYMTAVAVDGGGNIVVAGGADVGAASDLALARVSSNGVLDPAFGTGGIKRYTSGVPDEYDDAAIDFAGGHVTVASYVSPTIKLVRFSPTTGAVDTSFGSGGVAVTDFFPGGQVSLSSLAQQANGGFLVGGASKVAGLFQPFIGRVTAAGSIDTAFGTGGHTTLQAGAMGGNGSVVASLSDGRPALASTGGPGDIDFHVSAFTNGDDHTKPLIKINGPNTGAVATTNPPISASGTVSDNMTAKPKVVINGVTAEVTGTSWFARVPMVPGTNVFTATATDAAGNTATDTVTFTFRDKQAPKLSGAVSRGQGWLADILRGGVFGSNKVDEACTLTVTLVGPVPGKARKGKHPKTMVYGTKTYRLTRAGIQFQLWNIRLSKAGKRAIKQVKVGNTTFKVNMTAVDNAHNAKTISQPYIVRRPKAKAH